jgi:uncharacterized protein (DUF427 family)
MWEYRGQKRPPFAQEPAYGQESVWDYPRPPRVEACQRVVEIYDNAILLARATQVYRVCETGSPPSIYLPNQDIDWSQLAVLPDHTHCEWKGKASYWRLARDAARVAVAWSYPDPHPAFSMLRDHTSFYPERVACYLDDERVLPQPGKFYGGWVTADIIGPFKGEPGTGHW